MRAAVRQWLEEHLWINTRIGFIQRWAHRNGFCHVEKCRVGDKS